MPQSKALPKERYDRQRKGRAIRRTLADINLSNSHSQQQSLLFSLLPAEIRFLIFQYVLCQSHNPSRPVTIHSFAPLHRPGHTQRTIISTTLLQTCRLIYHEAHAIPLRSATHHFNHLGSTSWLYSADIWLHHISKQRGLELYHLHDNLIALNTNNFTKFFLPHLKWKKVSWTVCAYLWPPFLASRVAIERLSETLAGVLFPESCQEVTLELETREDMMSRWTELREQADVCRLLSLSRSDGVRLDFDDRFALQYTWVGSGQARWGSNEASNETEQKDYYTLRLCWRARVARREYMSYDWLDCLKLEGRKEVKRIAPLEWKV
jgi:hypothetical protein